MLCGTLCNPDHYQCYEAKVAPDTPKFEKRDVTLVDQFGPSSALIDKVKNLCNPVDKNDEEIIDPTAHLTCYNIKEFDPQFEQRIVFVNNQFGTLFLKVEKPERLCVPSEKNGLPSDLLIDHFQCYKVKVAPGTPKFEKQEVTLDDQFNSGTAIVEKPLALCNPVDKNGEGILNPANHLVCYSLNKGPKLDPKPEVTSVDQFGPLDLTVLKAERLCVPSTKEVSDEGSCCIANGTPGCEDDVCEDLVCALDPFCCGLDAQGQGFWDSFCAGPNTIVLGASALELCGDLCMDECVLEGGPCTDVHFATGPAGSKSVTECCEGLVCDLNGATTGPTLNGFAVGTCQVPQCLARIMQEP